MNPKSENEFAAEILDFRLALHFQHIKKIGRSEIPKE